MRFASRIGLVAACAGLTLSSPRAEEWRVVSAANEIVAAYKHVDGAAMQVICNTDRKDLSIDYKEPQAKWQEGRGVDVITLPDTGQQPSPGYGVVTTPTRVLVQHDVAFDLWTLQQARDSFKMSVGDVARVYPATNFRRAVEAVLKACDAQQ